MQEESVLSQVANTPEIVPAFGRSYAISKFTLGPLCQAFPYIGPLVMLLEQLREVPRDEKGLPDMGTQAGQKLLLTAFNVCGDSVFGLISVATKEPIEWLELQDPIDGLAIFAKVVEKSLSFFSPSEVERLMKAFDGLLQKTQTTGGVSSTTSSATGTDLSATS